jgi:hypothetical protein
MKEIIVILYIQMFLLSLFLVFEGYALYKNSKRKAMTRRRWARIKVPNEKMITCKVMYPDSLAADREFLINDINMGGISFFSDQKIENIFLKLNVKFPFTTFKEAGIVWGKVVYCNKVPDTEKYKVGISYTKRVKKN